MSLPTASSSSLLSCYNAQVLDNKGRYCDIATWTSALVYDRVPGNFSYFAPSSPLTVSQQNDYAASIFATLSQPAKKETLRSNCVDALKTLSCVTAFPECKSAGVSLSSMSYFPPCRLQCEQVNARCAASSQTGFPSAAGLKLACHSYPTKDCFLYVPPGFFVLPPSQGPFDALPALYGTVLAIWIVLTVVWNFLAFVRYKDSCVVLCRAIAGIPIIKCIVLVFGTAFWTTCASQKMCSFWMSVSLVNTHLVFETGEIVLFLLIAKGWTITRETFQPSEWRAVIFAMALFYMCNSIILVLEANVLSAQEFWICTASLYGLMYLYIFRCIATQLYQLSEQVSLLQRGGLIGNENHHPGRGLDEVEAPPPYAALVQPLRQKYFMYLLFLLLVLLSLSLEVLTHVLVATDGKLWFVLTVYEVSNLTILGTIGWIFRPREFSPFFFMVPTSQRTEQGAQQIPFLEMGCLDEDYYEAASPTSSAVVELGPLIATTRPGGGTGAQEPQSMILVCNPTHEQAAKYSIGLHGP